MFPEFNVENWSWAVWVYTFLTIVGLGNGLYKWANDIPVKEYPRAHWFLACLLVYPLLAYTGLWA